MATAASYEYNTNSTRIVGTPRTAHLNPQEDFASLAMQEKLGFDALVAANPGVNPWFAPAGTSVTLPTQHILPDVEHEGIVVNLPEMRLYYFDQNNNRVHTYPVGIGKAGWETPLADTRITSIENDPDWRPPPSILKEYRDAGLSLPKLVPAGPDNPLGDRAIRLALPGYLLHGTNKPAGVGLRVSHGCIRLYPDDIRELASMVTSGTRVQIINQPIKWANSNQGLQLEAHRPMRDGNYVKTAGHSNLVKAGTGLKKWLANRRDKQRLFSGVPQPVPNFNLSRN